MAKSDLTELRAALKLIDLPKVTIEEQLGIPKNCLSGMINGTKFFPEKWVIPLQNYVNNTRTDEDFAQRMDEVKEKLKVVEEEKVSSKLGELSYLVKLSKK